MSLTGLSRAGALRAAGVVLITAVVSLAAACSDEDTVDTIPPPWPNATNTSLGQGARVPTTSSTSVSPPKTSRPVLTTSTHSGTRKTS